MDIPETGPLRRVLSETLAELRRSGRHDDFARLLELASRGRTTRPRWDIDMARMCHDLENGGRGLATWIGRHAGGEANGRTTGLWNYGDGDTGPYHYISAHTITTEGAIGDAVRSSLEYFRRRPLLRCGSVMGAIAAAHSADPDAVRRYLSAGAGVGGEWIVALCGIFNDYETLGELVGHQMAGLMPRHGPEAVDRVYLAREIMRCAQDLVLSKEVARWYLQEIMPTETYSDGYSSRVIITMISSPRCLDRGEQRRAARGFGVDLIRKYTQRHGETPRKHRGPEGVRCQPDDVLHYSLWLGDLSPEEFEEAFEARRRNRLPIPDHMVLDAAFNQRRAGQQLSGAVRYELQRAVDSVDNKDRPNGHDLLLRDSARCLMNSEPDRRGLLVRALGECMSGGRGQDLDMSEHMRLGVTLSLADKDSVCEAIRSMCLDNDDWRLAAHTCDVLGLRPRIDMTGVAPDRYKGLNSHQMTVLADVNTLDPGGWRSCGRMATHNLHMRSDWSALGLHEVMEHRAAHQTLADIVLGHGNLGTSVLQLLGSTLSASGHRTWSEYLQYLETFYQDSADDPEDER